MLNRLETGLEAERERVGLWVPAGLGLGIGAWFGLPNPAGWAAWICGCGAIAILALALPEGGRLRALVAVGALLAALGCALVWGRALAVGAPPLRQPAVVRVEGRVLAVEERVARRTRRLTLAPQGPGAAALPGRVRVTLAERDAAVPGLGQGAVVRVRARLVPPPPAALPGAYDFAQAAYFQGIGATGRVLPPVVVVRPAPGDGASVRQRLAAHVRAALPGAEGAIAATLASGDRGAIRPEDAEAMRRSGLAHLLSISGLHVSALIGAVVLLVYRLLALVPRLALSLPLMPVAGAAGAAAGIGYTLLTGAEVPTVRACIAALLVLGGLALGREAISLRVIAAGAFVVLLLWPEALVGPSFQMSFAAVTVIVALMEADWFRALTQAPEARWAARWARGLAGLFATGAAVELALMPIAFYHFHQAGLLGALANLVAIPLTTFVVMPAEALALAGDGIGIGAPFWWVTGRALAALLAVAHAVAAQPLAVRALPGVEAGPFVVTVLGGLWLMLWRTRVRWLGLAPLVGGATAMLLVPVPDVLVTGDGRHMAVRQTDGSLALLRGRAGGFARATLAGVAGEGAEDDARLTALAEAPGARCSRDMCAVRVWRGGRAWTVLATRTAMPVPVEALRRACAAADVVVADRRLPGACRPRWLKLDRGWLAGHGGVLLYLGQGRWRSVYGPEDRHPWRRMP